MNKFKTKSLYLALAVGFGATGIAGTASAVYVNSNGLGQALIYPYYTVRNNMVTAISVVNTTSNAKAVKVRFLEGKNSREVLDFNLYMSRNDVWTGAIVDNGTGGKLVTTDTSCTYPVIPSGGQAFSNSAYSGSTIHEGIVDTDVASSSRWDGESQSLDRTREGYIEIIEMGTITDSIVTAAVTHVNGTPQNCAIVQTAAITMGNSGTNPLSAPSGGLSGGGTLINVAAGTDYTYDPTALDKFSTSNLWQPAGSVHPDLSAADNYSVVFYNNWVGGYDTVEDFWYSGAVNDEDAVSAVLMHDNIINEFVLDTITASDTDWVVTMPTKRFYVPVKNPSSSNTEVARPPFTEVFQAGGACEPVDVSYWDREENPHSSVQFSPPPPGGTALCWEANVVTFNSGSSIFGSTNSVNIPVSIPAVQDGWAELSFGQSYCGGTNPTTSCDNHDPQHSGYDQTYYGLPVVGFAVQSFTNGNVGGLLANYGGNFAHKYTTDISDFY